MVDINSHILFGVDEGSKNIEQSIRMIKEAKNAGYTRICVTPHYMNNSFTFSKKTIETNLEEIKNSLKKENVNVELRIGEEIEVYPELVDDLEFAVSLNNSRFILIDIPTNKDIFYLNELINKIQEIGKTPILAHAQSYIKGQRNFLFMEDLVARGVLLQVDINSIIGQYGEDSQNLACRLLKNNMVSFLASNSHSSAGYMMIKNSLEIIKDIIGEDKTYELTTINPTRALNNIAIDDTEYVKQRNKRKLENLISGFFRTISLNRAIVKYN